MPETPIPPFDFADLRNGTPFVGQKAVTDRDSFVANELFYPVIDINDFRARRQLDDSHSTDRVVDALQQAIAQVNSELAEWSCAQVKRGYDTLQSVPGAQLGSCNTNILAYNRAVYSTAQAILNRRWWEVSNTTVSANQATRDSLANACDDLERERWEALQQIRGEPRTLTGAL